MSEQKFRVEKDSMGELEVPEDALGCTDAACCRQLPDQRNTHAAPVHSRTGAYQVGERRC